MAPSDSSSTSSHLALMARQPQAVYDQSSRHWRPIEALRRHQQAISSNQSSPVLTSTPQLGKWINQLPKTDNVEFFLTSVNWSETDFGPVEHWPISLRTVASLVMSD